jgi:hypothetical protein
MRVSRITWRVLTGRYAAEHLSTLPARLSADVVIERSHHGPRFLGTFGTLAEAEAYRAGLLEHRPAWQDVLTVRPHASAPPTPATTMGAG